MEDSIEEFERKFARYIGVKSAVAVSSGTAGLMAAMMALVSEAGQTVVTTPLTFIATANSALISGGIPLFADIERETMNMNSNQATELAGATGQALLLPVHLYGLPTNVSALTRSKAPSQTIVEDAAQSLGAAIDGRKVGSLGDLAVFSFYATKHIPLGEGGMITTNNEEVAERCRMIRSHGQEKKYYHSSLGYNFRMPPILARQGMGLLSKVDRIVGARRKIARVYLSELSDVSGIGFQSVPSNSRHAYYRFPVLLGRPIVQKPHEVARAVKRRAGVELGTGYGLLVYQQPFYQNLSRLFWAAKFVKFPDYTKWRCPVAEDIVGRIIELPTDESVSPEAARDLAEALRETVSRAS